MCFWRLNWDAIALKNELCLIKARLRIEIHLHPSNLYDRRSANRPASIAKSYLTVWQLISNGHQRSPHQYAEDGVVDITGLRSLTLINDTGLGKKGIETDLLLLRM